MEESWKDVVGYEGLYQVSDLGRVKSLPRNTTKGLILKPYISKHNGYSYVSLCKGNNSKTHRVHVLVMNAFLPIKKVDGYDKEHTIDHIGGDKTNNQLSNLEWVSQRENQKRAFKLGLQKRSSKKVIDLDNLKIYESLTEAASSVGGKKANAITRVCKGERSNYRNHRFAYYEDYLKHDCPIFKGKPKRSCEKLWL